MERKKYHINDNSYISTHYKRKEIGFGGYIKVFESGHKYTLHSKIIRLTASDAIGDARQLTKDILEMNGIAEATPSIT